MSENRVVDSKMEIGSILRINEFIQKMVEQNLDYVVAYFNGVHTFLEPNFNLQLSGFKSIGESAVILSKSGETTLITTPSWDVERAKRDSSTTHVVGTYDLVEALTEKLQAYAKSPEKIGFIGLDRMNTGNYYKVSRLFNEGINNVTNDFKGIADVKTDKEIESARKATWIAERGFEKLLEVARPGMYEYQLAGELVTFMKSLGADDNFLLMSASSHNQAVRPPRHRKLEPGDIILAEISPGYQRQFSQICRSVVLGNENYKQLQEKYHLLVYAMDEGIKAAKPGNRMSDVFYAINKPIEEAGYAKYCVPPYMRVRGHGLGLSSLLPGDVGMHNDIVLKDGMFFVIHPNQYMPETGYLLCGEPVLITANGAETLTNKRASLSMVDL
ncbi:Xaa-Pro peptidase family protein [Robertmurraya massiliosenegalensis]|uniref:M24 family metallopeptidase n=1 Tax=Robertmurraya TaxID=2837507 RepID=UPI0039A701F4